jgi:hypothetical protein
MSLADHYDGRYLGAGWHQVRVESYDCRFATTGTGLVEFTVRADNNSTSRATFFLTEKAMYRLAGFAKACGLSRDDAKRYDEQNANSHQVLVGARLNVHVEPKKGDDGKTYHRVTDWAGLDEDPDAPVSSQLDGAIKATATREAVAGFTAEEAAQADATAANQGNEIQVPF